jgi:hypothetical protein
MASQMMARVSTVVIAQAATQSGLKFSVRFGSETKATKSLIAIIQVRVQTDQLDIVPSRVCSLAFTTLRLGLAGWAEAWAIRKSEQA